MLQERVCSEDSCDHPMCAVWGLMITRAENLAIDANLAWARGIQVKWVGKRKRNSIHPVRDVV